MMWAVGSEAVLISSFDFTKHWFTKEWFTKEWTPAQAWMAIASGYLLIRSLFDFAFLLNGAFPAGYGPWWQDDGWWSQIVNAALLGYVPAALMMARRGIDRDLVQIEPCLAENTEAGETTTTKLHGKSGLTGSLLRLSGIPIGIGLVLLDPSLSLGSEQTLSNPVFLWPLLQTPLFTWLVFTLIVRDVDASRAYHRLGKHHIAVDLLNTQALAPFARRGLRSALMWIVFMLIFSLFWIGDRASAANPLLLIVLLGMTTSAFAMPLLGVHANIASTKQLELDRLLGEIRTERAMVSSTSPRLANLISDYQFISEVREWPIDAANVLRFLLYLVIGLGSWLGGAVVEQLLERSMSG